MASISKPEFEAALAQSVTRRESNYSHYYTLHFRFEDDNTNAYRDGENFKQLVQLMGFAAPDTYIIPKTERTPFFELERRLYQIVSKTPDASRSLIIVHYAGHGTTNNLNGQELGSLSGTKIDSSLLFCLTNSYIPLDLPVDFIVIFDCCHSFFASRNTDPDSRLVDVLSSGDERDPLAFPARTRNSLTSKLLVDIRSRAQEGEKRVEIADLMDKLRQKSPVRKPNYAPKLGLGSITLPLNTAWAATSSTPTSSLSDMLATFSVHVSKTFDRQELQDLVSWLQQLSKAPPTKLNLENVKETNSTLFIFESSCLCFFRICGLPGVSLICENLPNDFSWLLHPNPSISPRSTSGGEPSRVNDEDGRRFQLSSARVLRSAPELSRDQEGVDEGGLKP